MRRPTLPTSFTLVNRKWTVRYVSKEEMAQVQEEGGHPAVNDDGEDATLRGMCDDHTATIWINRDARHPDDLINTFYHELFHALLFTEGVSGSLHDEAWVDRFGRFMQQFEQTKKGNYRPEVM